MCSVQEFECTGYDLDVSDLLDDQDDPEFTQLTEMVNVAFAH